MSKNIFDSYSSGWGSSSFTLSASENFEKGIRLKTKIFPNMTILDFGCGSGNVGLGFIDEVQKVIFVDTSSGMINSVKNTLKSKNKKNYELLNGSIQDYKGEPVDLVISSLAFHHVDNLEETIKLFKKFIKSGGKIIIADLYLGEAGFHGFKIPHEGFDPEKLKKIFEKCGFKNVTHERFADYVLGKHYKQFILVAES